jgi:hypothetical protein
MDKVRFDQGAGDKFTAGIIATASIQERVGAAGLWSVRHNRPCNDVELRKAVEAVEIKTEMNQIVEAGFMANPFGLRARRMARDIRRIGSIKRVEIHAEDFKNAVVEAGLDHLLDVTLSHASGTANWYIGLKDTGTPNAADTMASHGTWATISPYSDANDLEWIDAGVSGQSCDNTGSTADYSINETDEVFGAFLKDNNVVDSATGLLYAAGDFASPRSVESGDTLQVTATFTSAAV